MHFFSTVGFIVVDFFELADLDESDETLLEYVEGFLDVESDGDDDAEVDDGAAVDGCVAVESIDDDAAADDEVVESVFGGFDGDGF